MASGEFLTRGTIWISIFAYTLGCISFAVLRNKPYVDSITRIAWTVAVAALIAHYVFAFQFYHAWSHHSAYIETARQTAEVFKMNWGGGLFMNYALLVLWMIDVGWWWFRGLNSYRRRPWLLLLLWHSFLIFIIFNATVVFKDGLQRWVGMLICLSLGVSWFVINRKRSLLTV
jgi:hypothetical protein